jgi:hypothetical protein
LVSAQKAIPTCMPIDIVESPVVTLLGARQVGKTTLARQVQEQVGGATVYDLESPTGRAALDRTPELALRDCEGLVVIDEVQRMPSLFEILRPICDEATRKANFLVLGSASPDLVRGISETLAGRTQFIPVPGFSLGEVGGEEQNKLWYPLRARMSPPPPYKENDGVNELTGFREPGGEPVLFLVSDDALVDTGDQLDIGSADIHADCRSSYLCSHVQPEPRSDHHASSPQSTARSECNEHSEDPTSRTATIKNRCPPLTAARCKGSQNPGRQYNRGSGQIR